MLRSYLHPSFPGVIGLSSLTWPCLPASINYYLSGISSNFTCCVKPKLATPTSVKLAILLYTLHNWIDYIYLFTSLSCLARLSTWGGACVLFFNLWKLTPVSQHLNMFAEWIMINALCSVVCILLDGPTHSCSFLSSEEFGRMQWKDPGNKVKPQFQRSFCDGEINSLCEKTQWKNLLCWLWWIVSKSSPGCAEY